MNEIPRNVSSSEPTKWDTLSDIDDDAIDDEEVIDIDPRPNVKHIEFLQDEIEEEKKQIRELVNTYCKDKEGTLVSDDLRVAESNHRSQKEIALDYVRLTESELILIETRDELDKSSKRNEAETFASTQDQFGAGMAIAHDIIGVNKALDDYHLANQRGFFEGWNDRKDALKALKKFGYNDKGPQSEVFSIILQQAKAIRMGIPTKDTQVDDILGRKRICDYQETMLLLEDEATSNSCRNALKKAGYKELPESWSDRNFSTHDIAEMCRIAREAAA